MKSLANLGQEIKIQIESKSTKGDQCIDLVCERINLNKRYDHHNTEIDCFDERKGPTIYGR